MKQFLKKLALVALVFLIFFLYTTFIAPDKENESENLDVPIGQSTEFHDTDTIPQDGSYTSRDDVAMYIHIYGKLPDNFMTKKEAKELGWQGGGLDSYAQGMCIGGDKFGNYEGNLPEKEGRQYYECDIDTLGSESRGAKRIVFSNDGLIYYTDDHYDTFTLLYDSE